MSASCSTYATTEKMHNFDKITTNYIKYPQYTCPCDDVMCYDVCYYLSNNNVNNNNTSLLQTHGPYLHIQAFKNMYRIYKYNTNNKISQK